MEMETHKQKIKDYLKKDWKRKSLGLAGFALSIMSMFYSFRYVGRAHQEIYDSLVKPAMSPQIKEVYDLTKKIDPTPSALERDTGRIKNFQEQITKDLESLSKLYQTDPNLTKKIAEHRSNYLHYLDNETKLIDG